MSKIEFHTNKIDVGSKRLDGTRKVTIEVDQAEHERLLPILILPERYKLKISIEDQPIDEEFGVKL